MGAYCDLNSHLRSLFGQKVYKIALSTPFTCPNRDGTCGTGGCIFCSGSGSGNFAAASTLPIAQQLAEAKKRVRHKLGANPLYIAYFQSFTSTYGPVEVQRRLFSEAIGDSCVVALSVATRPDCLPKEVLDLLEELNRIKPVWVELGFQTAREETARFIRRGYDNDCFVQAVRELKKRGLSVIVHLILGLPGEDHQDEIESLRYVCNEGIHGIKFHLLHVLKGTELSQMEYTPLEREEYVFRVTDLLRYVPKNVVIHRLTGDGDKNELLAPLWSADKKRVLNEIQRRLRVFGIVQGEALQKKAQEV